MSRRPHGEICVRDEHEFLNARGVESTLGAPLHFPLIQ
jgi:hypothetical protein